MPRLSFNDSINIIPACDEIIAVALKAEETTGVSAESIIRTALRVHMPLAKEITPNAPAQGVVV